MTETQNITCETCAQFHLNHPDLPPRWKTGNHGLCQSPVMPGTVQHKDSIRCRWWIDKEEPPWSK